MDKYRANRFIDVTVLVATHQGDRAPENVTSARTPPLTPAERKRRQREKDRGSPPLMFETADWHLFMDASTLGQKAGCRSGHIGCLVLRELVDNALDTGATVTLTETRGIEQQGNVWTVSDNGPGDLSRGGAGAVLRKPAVDQLQINPPPVERNVG